MLESDGQSVRAAGDLHLAKSEAAAAIESLLSVRPSRSEAALAAGLRTTLLWTQLEPGGSQPPAPRSASSLVLVGRRLYLVGGLCPFPLGPACSVDVLDIDRSVWVNGHAIATVPAPACAGAIGVLPTGGVGSLRPGEYPLAVPASRYAQACVAVSGHSLVMIGGFGEGKWLSDVWMLHTSSQPLQWAPLDVGLSSTSDDPWSDGPHDGDVYVPGPLGAGSRPRSSVMPPRAGHSAVPVDDGVLVFGGNDSRQYFQDCWLFPLDGTGWQRMEVNGILPERRTGHSAVVLHVALPDKRFTSAMVVYGGSAGDGPKSLGDVCCLDLGSREWTSIRPAGEKPLARTGHGAAAFGGSRMLVFGGGQSSRALNDVWCLDCSSWPWRWFRVTDVGGVPRPRVSSAITAVGSALVMFGGMNHDGVSLGDLHSLDASDLGDVCRLEEERGAAARTDTPGTTSGVRMMVPGEAPRSDSSRRVERRAQGGARLTSTDPLRVALDAEVPLRNRSGSGSSVRSAPVAAVEATTSTPDASQFGPADTLNRAPASPAVTATDVPMTELFSLLEAENESRWASAMEALNAARDESRRALALLRARLTE
jgi:hypothetical protein